MASWSTTDFRLVLGPAFGSRTILCCMGNHGQPLAPAIMNIFDGRPWFDHVALYVAKKVWIKFLIKKLIRKKIFFGEIFLKIWLRFENFSLKNKPKINPVFLGWVKFSNLVFGWVRVLKFRVRFGLGFLKKPGFRIGFR